ncbi:ComEC/Rec2 family competence protein [Pseudomonas fluorescens]|uniref:ComEC/Rec2 family competence protein n=1 Tax=Pseudomonas fluorescens TaxID=294 RepID=UPI0002F782EF|nr:MBL fold metallo-hydrolase [Pseudomonas fluorescens]
MKISMHDAAYGDSILISGASTKILVDGGTAKSFADWSPSLEGVDTLDALIVTHIDNDHIGGAIKLLTSKHATKVKEVYFNGINQILDVEDCDIGDRSDDLELSAIIANTTSRDEDQLIGYSEGTSLSLILQQQNIPLNKATEGRQIHRTSLNKNIIIGEFEIELIGPSRKSLLKIQQKWLELLESKEIKRRLISPRYSVAFESFISSIDTSVKHDEEISSLSENIEHLANQPFTNDTSPPNKSSISFLLKTENKSILMLGDSDAETIEAWLNSKSADSITVDAVKLPHHGSRNNFSANLVRRIRTANYLISTNGDKFSHPNIETLARIIKFSPDREAKILLNHEIPHLTNSFLSNANSYEGNISIHQGIKEFEL